MGRGYCLWTGDFNNNKILLWIFIIKKRYDLFRLLILILRIIYWFLASCSSMKWHFETELVFFIQLSNLHRKSSCLFNWRKLDNIKPCVHSVSFHIMHSHVRLWSSECFSSTTKGQHTCFYMLKPWANVKCPKTCFKFTSGWVHVSQQNVVYLAPCTTKLQSNIPPYVIKIIPSAVVWL